MEKVLELYVRMVTTLRQERGQTAAEYMGILFVIAVIIGAVVAANIDNAIADAAKRLIESIEGGGKKD